MREVLTFDLFSFGDVCFIRFDSSCENFGTQLLSFGYSVEFHFRFHLNKQNCSKSFKNLFTLITVQCTVVKLIFQASVHTVVQLVHSASGPITYFYLNVFALLEFFLRFLFHE